MASSSSTPFSFIVFLVLCTLSITPSLAARQHCNPKDKKVLLQIQKTLNYPYVITSWKKDTDCCTWYTVICNNSRIVSLDIANDHTVSQIPAAVGDLPFLTYLSFHKLPNLTAPIPEAIAKLTHLRYLILSWNNISGSVPASLSRLKNLQILDLSFNNLTGEIPPQLAQLPNLQSLYLDRNKLTGQIPDSFGNSMTNFPSIYLSHNLLTGTIPKSLGKLNLTTIDLSRNRLHGDLSMLFGVNKTIQIAVLSRNNFTFDLTKVKFSSSSTSLDVSHNKIYGRLPADLTKLRLQYLNVSYNRLCGPIPQGGELQSFESFDYFHNRCLCGLPLQSCRK